MRYTVLTLFIGAMVGCGGSASSGGSTSGGGGSGSGAAANKDPHVQHNLDTINMYRSQNGANPLVLDDQLTTFSIAAAKAFESSGTAHGYFAAEGKSGALWKSDGFCSAAAENQAPGSDWNIGSDEDAAIDAILKAMMDEGPGGGHHDNIVGTQYTRLGVGLVLTSSGGLWFSNDFSAGCN